jgi:hypothetical protein
VSGLPSARALALALKTKRVPLTPAKKALKEIFHPVSLLADHLSFLGLPTPVREHRFHPSRRWAFDLAWPDHLLAVEYDGGTYSKGRRSGHTSISGMARDKEKDAEAAILGWSVIRLDARSVKGKGPDWIVRWFEARKNPLPGTPTAGQS